MAQERSKYSNQNRFPISVEVLPGRGDAAFFANIRLGDLLTIYDFPVWKYKEGLPEPALPTRVVGGERLPVVDIAENLRESVFEAIREACKECTNQNPSS
ncbi:MAG: hypothetical protein HY313_02780 [Acidobacteria bacterium]|nr:hypothetical protein [Acidobacteriota bacterium]